MERPDYEVGLYADENDFFQVDTPIVYGPEIDPSFVDIPAVVTFRMNTRFGEEVKFYALFEGCPHQSFVNALRKFLIIEIIPENRLSRHIFNEPASVFMVRDFLAMLMDRLDSDPETWINLMTHFNREFFNDCGKEVQNFYRNGSVIQYDETKEEISGGSKEKDESSNELDDENVLLVIRAKKLMQFFRKHFRYFFRSAAICAVYKENLIHCCLGGSSVFPLSCLESEAVHPKTFTHNEIFEMKYMLNRFSTNALICSSGFLDSLLKTAGKNSHSVIQRLLAPLRSGKLSESDIRNCIAKALKSSANLSGNGKLGSILLISLKYAAEKPGTVVTIDYKMNGEYMQYKCDVESEVSPPHDCRQFNIQEYERLYANLFKTLSTRPSC